MNSYKITASNEKDEILENRVFLLLIAGCFVIFANADHPIFLCQISALVGCRPRRKGSNFKLPFFVSEHPKIVSEQKAAA